MHRHTSDEQTAKNKIIQWVQKLIDPLNNHSIEKYTQEYERFLQNFYQFLQPLGIDKTEIDEWFKNCLKNQEANKAILGKTDSNQNTILHAAASHGNKDLIDFLLFLGADITLKNDKQETACLIAIKSNHLNSEVISETLIMHLVNQQKNNKNFLDSSLLEMITSVTNIDSLTLPTKQIEKLLATIRLLVANLSMKTSTRLEINKIINSLENKKK